MEQLNLGIRRVIKIFIPVFVAFGMIVSCKSNKEIMMDMEILKPKITYLALGDSYTIGQGVMEDQRWPNQLGAKMETLNYEFDKLDIIAQTGWRTSNLLNAIENAEIEGYNLVSLLIGVNNQYQHQAFTIFENEFDLLLAKSIEIAGGIDRVFVVSIPDYGVTPFGSGNSEAIGQEIDMYNDYMRNKCQDQRIPFIDITEISRALADSPGALAADNLHPGGDQYAQWVTEILPIVVELVEE